MFPLFLRYYLVLQMLFCFYFEESKGQIFINVMFEKRQTSCHQTYSKGKNSVSIQIIESDLFSPLFSCMHSVSPGFSPCALGRRMRKFPSLHLLVPDSHLTQACNSWSQCNLTWSWGCGNLIVIFAPRNWAIGIYQKLKCNRQLFSQLYLCVSMIWITMFFFLWSLQKQTKISPVVFSIQASLENFLLSCPILIFAFLFCIHYRTHTRQYYVKSWELLILLTDNLWMTLAVQLICCYKKTRNTGKWET